MAIAFQLHLTPSQIEFLQHLDLYTRGVYARVTDIPIPLNRLFFSYMYKLTQEGLVVHNHPTSSNGKTSGESWRHYKITAKGQSVLALIDDDVRSFMSRQATIHQLRRPKLHRRA